MIARETGRARALVRDALADYGEAPLQPLDAITYDEATILGRVVAAGDASRVDEREDVLVLDEVGDD